MPIGIHNPQYSLKPRRGRSWKRLRRIEIVALLESKFVSDQQIADHLGLTIGAIQAIKSTPEFLAQRMELSTGVLSTYKLAALSNAEAQKDELESLVPFALHSVKRILQDPLHKDHAKVALDIFDRTKATSKISRTEHSVEVAKDFHRENESARALLALLNDPDPQGSDPGQYSTTIGLLETESQVIDVEVNSEPEPEIISPDPFEEMDPDSIVQ